LIGELMDAPESSYRAPQTINPFPILTSHPAQTFSIR
jgi:hypothetical protein